MPYIHTRFCALLLALFLAGCAPFSSLGPDWDHIDYAQLSCGSDHSTGGCKVKDDDLSNISKGGKGR